MGLILVLDDCSSKLYLERRYIHKDTHLLLCTQPYEIIHNS